MTVNTESLGANSSSETRSVFYCPEWPEYIWDLNHTTSLKIIIAVTTIACPVTILLNLLVIIAVKTRRELNNISNIMLSHLAVTDLLVGAVVLPLTLAVDALILQRTSSEDVICTIGNANYHLMYLLYSVSFLHLLIIAWERYVAITKWMRYKVIVTRKRLRKYTIFAWLSVLLPEVPIIVIRAVGVRNELELAAASVAGIIWFGGFLLFVYFYVKAYLGIRKWNRTQAHTLAVNALVRARLETKMARTAFWLTVFVGISGVPNLLSYYYHIFGNEGYVFRWTETILLLNSLFNPLLYFYRNRQLREAALELLRCRKPSIMQPEARIVRRTRRRRYSEAPQNVEEYEMEQMRPRLKRSKSCDAVMCSDTFQWVWNETVKERPTSAPTKVFAQKPNKATVQNSIKKRPCLKRSESCDAVMCLDHAGQRAWNETVKKRSTSLPPAKVFAQQPNKATVPKEQKHI